jgi:hypothetical protein
LFNYDIAKFKDLKSSVLNFKREKMAENSLNACDFVAMLLNFKN